MLLVAAFALPGEHGVVTEAVEPAADQGVAALDPVVEEREREPASDACWAELEAAAAAFRDTGDAEAEIAVPDWEPVIDSVRVEVRTAVGWPYAPASFIARSRK